MTARHQRTLSDTPLRKRRKTSAIEEITFDHAAREDFITGFHKRKLQRARYAREVALRKEREEKIAARKAVFSGTPRLQVLLIIYSRSYEMREKRSSRSIWKLSMLTS